MALPTAADDEAADALPIGLGTSVSPNGGSSAGSSVSASGGHSAPVDMRPVLLACANQLIEACAALAGLGGGATVGESSATSSASSSSSSSSPSSYSSPSFSPSSSSSTATSATAAAAAAAAAAASGAQPAAHVETARALALFHAGLPSLGLRANAHSYAALAEVLWAARRPHEVRELVARATQARRLGGVSEGSGVQRVMETEGQESGGQRGLRRRVGQ
jgi:hypothetical protein